MKMFDTELFINAIQCRPQLWNLKLKEYSDRDIKGKLWIEIASVVVEKWDELDNPDKNKEVKELQTKWKSIRDAFAREVRLQKQPSGSGKRTRKRYVYFDQLLFLLDTLTERPTLTNIDAGEAVGGENESDENHELDSTATPTLAVSNVPSIRRSAKRKGNSFEDDVLQHIKSRSTNEENDGDKLFLLSVLPMFRKFSDRTKLWTRMKITEVMQQALSFETPITVYQPPSGSSNHPEYPQHQNPANFTQPVYTTGYYRIQPPAPYSTGQPAPSPTVIQPAVSPTYTDLSSASTTAWSPPSNDSSLFDVL